MRDHTLIRHRNTAGRDHGDNLAADQITCSIPHCEGRRADRVNIHLCEKHIEKAWAAYQVLQGFGPQQVEEPDRDRHSLDARGTVYVVRIGDLIKIGWTSDPTKRMQALKPDAILNYKAGTRRDEYKLQAQCMDHLAKGREWFTYNDEMLAIVNNIRAGKQAA